jgi:hypothetical protein
VVDVKDNRKRDLSPPSKSNHNAPVKKNRSAHQQDVWRTWNKDGVHVATSWGVDTLRAILNGKTKPDLNELEARVSLAAENFKSLFSVDDEPDDVIRYRNEEPHTEFLSLQTELKIPSISEGRAYSLQFYYGKVIGAIHDVLARRENFIKCPDDADKLKTYLAHRGADHPEVVAFMTADDQQRTLKGMLPRCVRHSIEGTGRLHRKGVLNHHG